MSSSLYGAGVEYALHSLLVLASRATPASVSDLAAYQGIPERFLAKVFGRLKKAGLVKGTEGISGGFSLARAPEAIPVLEVLEAVDPGRSLFTCAEIRGNCALFGKEAPDWAISGPCRIHAFMESAERELKAVLASRTVADLVCELRCKMPENFAKETDQWFEAKKKGRTLRNKSQTQA